MKDMIFTLFTVQMFLFQLGDLGLNAEMQKMKLAKKHLPNASGIAIQHYSCKLKVWLSSDGLKT